MTTRIHVSQNAIRENNKDGGNRPVIIVKTDEGDREGHEVEILGSSRVVYSHDKPLEGGAKVWIETDGEVIIK
jgi:hypothetical protein